MAARKTVKVPIDPRQDAEFDRAFDLLRELVDWSAADREFPLRGNAIYITSVVLWMLVSQRMNPERSLESAVKRLIDTQPDFLPRNKRVVEGTLSKATGSYSRARTRLQREAAEWFALRVSESLIEATAPSWNGRRVYTVDGTTITLVPEPALRRAFPPASNQHGVNPGRVGVWRCCWCPAARRCCPPWGRCMASTRSRKRRWSASSSGRCHPTGSRWPIPDSASLQSLGMRSRRIMTSCSA